MSRQFFGTADHLDAAIATITGYPFAMSMWVKNLGFGNAAGKSPFNIGQAGTGNSSCRIIVNSSDAPSAQTVDTGGTPSTALGSGTLDAVTYNQMSANFGSATSRDIYFNGGGKASNATSRVLGVLDSVRVSGSLAATPGVPFVGLIAHVAYWSNTLSDEEHRLLSCYTPNRVRSDILIDYWDLLADTATFTSTGPAGTVMTPTGSKFSLDNPQFAPAFPYYA